MFLFLFLHKTQRSYRRRKHLKLTEEIQRKTLTLLIFLNMQPRKIQTKLVTFMDIRGIIMDKMRIKFIKALQINIIIKANHMVMRMAIITKQH